jgi:transcriptional regulator with XRE-family HTH domain
VSRQGKDETTDMFSAKVFGKHIRHALVDMDMTQEQFANVVGISHAAMSRLTRGIGAPSMDSYFRIIQALGYNTENLPGYNHIPAGSAPATTSVFNMCERPTDCLRPNCTCYK